MIRNFKSTDIDNIMNIWLKSTIKAHDFINKEHWENSYDTVKTVYIPIAETLVYEDNEGIKGFISIINNEFIGALFVDVAFQGNGIGKNLINYAIDKYNELTLAVYKENKKSVEFYINRGFKIIKEQVNDDSGHSEYLMQRELKRD
ncbi:N-acetyltransferase [Clostridium sp. KNHs214]|uniref:N-acetyltransferase n=1 Tax=Clostridium sp. KNHs214 TaxID=1540257 RepID=UPI0005550E85|nr:N-acetyltransferase [Clostridium sp. KNHs214]